MLAFVVYLMMRPVGQVNQRQMSLDVLELCYREEDKTGEPQSEDVEGTEVVRHIELSTTVTVVDQLGNCRCVKDSDEETIWT